MAIITTYPVDPSPTTGDYLVGSKITNTGAQINPTKNFTIGSVVQAGVGYTAYTAIINQSGTDAPVATILKNNTGYTYTWTRTGAGEYTITASGNAFTSNKTIVFVNCGNTGFNKEMPSWEVLSTTAILIGQPPLGDGAFVNGALEIRIYS